MIGTILFILLIGVLIICFSNVIAINKIVFKHANEVFSFKSEAGKVYRRQVFLHFVYAISSIVGYFIIALLVAYINGNGFKVHY